MTNIEAYKWLYTHFAPCGDETKQDEAVNVALKALQTQQKQTACDFCHEDRDGYVRSIQKNGHAFISGRNLVIRVKGWHDECPIHFCPMCGRSFTLNE